MLDREVQNLNLMQAYMKRNREKKLHDQNSTRIKISVYAISNEISDI